MALLGAKHYNPTTAVTKATTAAIAMTALDTTNLRISFTVPSNGIVLVRLRGTIHGGTTFPQVLLGVLQSTTVIARHAPVGGLKTTAVATSMMTVEALFAVSGLTPGANLTWDAAYGVETLVASTGIKYGGPNDTTANNAFGGFVFEIWEANDCVAAVSYDPTSAVTKSAASLLALTAIDTTNLRIAFTVPSSGSVLVRLKGTVHGATTMPTILLGVLQSTTVIGTQAPAGSLLGTALATTFIPQEASFVVTGLTPGASLTWDAAYSVETLLASTGIKYGGPNNTTANDAFGAFLFEIWAA